MAIFLLLLSYISLAVGQALCQVYGISNSSINLTSPYHPNNVKEVTWKHDIKLKRYQIAKIKHGILFGNHSNRYKLFYNGTVLSINEINHNDSGLYIADVTFLNDTSEEVNIYLEVLDPIPPPWMKIKIKKGIGDWCNVTLYCYVQSNTSDFSYTWNILGHRESEYQLYNNGSILQKSLPLDHQDTEFLCIADNKADQKNTSVLISHCSVMKMRSRYIFFTFLISMLIVVVVTLTLVVCWKWLKKSQFTCQKGKVKDLGEELDKNEEMKRLTENEHAVVVMQDANDQDDQMQIQTKEHKNDEDESEELLLTPPTETSDLDDEMQAQMVKEHGNEGHQDERNDQEGHETEENECQGHEIEEHENEKHLTILVEESRNQTDVEEHKNNEPENEEHLTIPVEESGEQDGNNVNETENEENLTIPVQETDHVRKLQRYSEKMEHLLEDENTGGLLQDTSGLDEQDKVEEPKKNDDYENEDDLTLVEETGDQKGQPEELGGRNN